MLNQYNPDVVSIPGETISDILEDRHITRAQLAKKIGCSKEVVDGLISGEVAISYKIAHQFKDLFGVSAEFWINLERNYREWLVRKGKIIDKKG